MTAQSEPPRANNFDGLRLFAALQVLLFHGVEHLRLGDQHPWLVALIGWIRHVPGVPVFFVLSGFLIPWAWTRTPDPQQYARNRFLRMFPALWVALAVSIAVMAVQGVVTLASFTRPPMIAWLVAQLSFGQFYTPSELRGYGLGNPNGSLWTVVVELQFYVLVPVFLRGVRGSRRRANLAIVALIVASIAANLIIGTLDTRQMATKLLGVSLAPYLFYFLLGTLVWTNWTPLHRLFLGRAVHWSITFIAFSAVFGEWLGLYTPSYWPRSVFGFVAIALLAGAVLGVGFSGSALQHALAGADLSYGVYLYHGILLNVLVHQRWTSLGSLAMLIVSSIVVAWCSWRLVEQPSLSRKRRSLSPPVSIPVNNATPLETNHRA
jgi:peptidoglycan/LPS O-acetylase OafA/YrhL